MVKKSKHTNTNNPDHLETLQETQLDTLAKLQRFEERIAELQNRYDKVEEKLEVTEDKFKRVLADYHNQERRHKEQESLIIKMSSAALIEKLLVCLDSLVLAQAHLKDQGLQMVLDQFKSTFSQEGLTLIESNGKDFDPLTMDCTEVVPGEKNKVIETLSPGYYIYDRVLRPAKVKVGSGS